MIDPMGMDGRPSAGNIWYSYPNYQTFGAGDVYALVGGELGDLYAEGKSDYQESCALRLSYALNNAGGQGDYAIPSSIPGLSLHSLTTQDGPLNDGTANVSAPVSYITSAADMSAYLQHAWGPADQTISINQDPQSLQNHFDKLQATLQDGQIAIVATDSHIGVITQTSKDEYVAYPSSDAKVWILNAK